MNIFRIIVRSNFKNNFLKKKFDINVSQSYILRNISSNQIITDIHSRKICLSAFLWKDVVVKTPQFAESVSEGDIRWEKAVGDSVNVDDLIGEIETDKTAVPVHASCAGVITSLLVSDGDKVIANQDLATIAPKAGDDTTVSVESQPKKEVTTKVDEVKNQIKEVKVEKQLPQSVLKTEKLIREITPPPQLKVTLSDKAGVEHISGSRGEQRVKMNRMRQRIAQRLKDAQNTCAMLTTFNECDMSSVIDLRQRYKDQFQKKHGVKLGFMSAFVKAAAVALRDQPVVNAVIDGTDIIYRDYVDISVAVSTPKGLVVPVLRDAHDMNFAEIEKGIFELGEKARLGQLAVEDMDGGTFTISNGGVFGSLMGTPIINPPQSAILGIHATQQRPVAIDGRVEIRPMMYLALTYDHRLVDGREAVTFLRKIKAFIEDPRNILLDL